MAKYYRHKENPYVVGGVNWRKIIKHFSLGIIVVIVLLIAALRVQAVIEYISDPRIRTEPEFYKHLTDVFEKSGVQVIAEGSDADITFPDGTIAKCSVFCDPDYYSDRISRINVSYAIKDAGHTADIVEALMSVMEPDFIKNDGWFFLSYEELLALCSKCDSTAECVLFTDEATYGRHATHITFESSYSDNVIIKSITMELRFR